MTWSYGNAYERLDEDGAVMYVLTAERLRLQVAGLSVFGDFIGFSGGEVVSRHGSMRQVARLEMKTPAVLSGDLSAEASAKAELRGVYLKRSGPSHLKDALKDLLRLRRVRTRALHEFDMLLRFRRAGLGVPDALAAGERHILGRDVGSFVLVGALRGGRPLDVALTEPEDEAVRLRLIRSVARSVRAMHDKGFTHGELFAWHVLVVEQTDATLVGHSSERRREDDGGWSLSLINLRHARQAEAASRGRRARDVAALLVSLPPDETTMRERLAFLREYLGKKRLSSADLDFAREAVLTAARRFTRRDRCRAWRAAFEETPS